MTIVLCSRAALPGVIARHDPEIIISAVGRGETVPTPTDRCSTIHLAFNDVQHDHGPWRAPTARHVERLGVVVDEWTERRPLVVHCHEGRSRAPAVALGVMCRRGVDPSLAIVRLLCAAPWVKPHQGFLKLLDAAVGDTDLASLAMRMTHGSEHHVQPAPDDQCEAIISLWGCRTPADSRPGARVATQRQTSPMPPCCHAGGPAIASDVPSSEGRGSFPDLDRVAGGGHPAFRQSLAKFPG